MKNNFEKRVFTEEQSKKQANFYATKYKGFMEHFVENNKKTALKEAKIVEKANVYEVLALGQQLDAFNHYKIHKEGISGLGSMGELPKIALDVITNSNVNSILPLVASIQPIQEQHGIIYYKQIKASQVAGGYNTGDVIADPLTLDNLGDGTFGSQRGQVSVDPTGQTFTVTIPVTPLVPGEFQITVPTLNLNGTDDGQGNILGTGFGGTIDYAAGTVSLDFGNKTLTSGTDIVYINYEIDTDRRDRIDRFEGSLLTKDVNAQVFALQTDWGTLSNMAFQKRFGRSSIAEINSDLTNEITRVLNTNAILTIVRGYNSALVPAANWDATPGTGVSFAENLLSFAKAIADAEASVFKASGANRISRLIAGTTACTYLASMPGFKYANTNTVSHSIDLYGYYNGIPIIRANAFVDTMDIYTLSNAQNYFNAPVIYAPYMPLILTGDVEGFDNAFKNTKGIANWSAFAVGNAGLIGKITITV